MNFPDIHTNFWDAVIAVPLIMIITQLIKVFLHVPKKYVPTIAVVLGFIIAIFFGHRHSLAAGIFMGWFYGYAAIGNYAAMKTFIVTFRKSD
jgi:hypothetical protein